MTHTVTGKEDFLQMTLAEVGVPALHILRAYNPREYRFYELTGDLKETLHFSHFEKPSLVGAPREIKVHLGEEEPSIGEKPKDKGNQDHPEGIGVWNPVILP